MISLNMMIGTQEILLASILLIIVALIESVFLSKQLSNKWFVKDIVISIFISNIFSAIVGIIGILGILSEFIFDILKNIFPISKDNSGIYTTIIFFVIAFLFTLLIEIPFNQFFLTDYKKRKIFIQTIFANIVSYIFLGLLTFLGLIILM